MRTDEGTLQWARRCARPSDRPAEPRVLRKCDRAAHQATAGGDSRLMFVIEQRGREQRLGYVPRQVAAVADIYLGASRMPWGAPRTALVRLFLTQIETRQGKAAHTPAYAIRRRSPRKAKFRFSL